MSITIGSVDIRHHKTPNWRNLKIPFDGENFHTLSFGEVIWTNILFSLNFMW